MTVDIHHLKTVAVDFDGVIHTYKSGWTGYTPTDGPEPGAREFVNELLAQGYRVVIMSSRAHNELGLRAIRSWLADYGFPELEVTHEKVMAVAYVDDRAVPYTTGSGAWSDTKHRIDALANQASTQDRLLPDPLTVN